jgi:hypothetical protein
MGNEKLLTCHRQSDTTNEAPVSNSVNQRVVRTYLILKSCKVRIVAIIHLPFVVDDCEKIVIVHSLRTSESEAQG